MPLQTSVYRFEVPAHAFGQAVVNYLDFRLIAPAADPTEAEMLQFLSVLHNYWVDNMLPLLSEEYEVEAFYLREIVDAQIVDPGPPPRYRFIYDTQLVTVESPPASGGLEGEVLPTYVAATIWKVSGTTSRNYRGTLRFGPIIEANTFESNQLLPGYVTNLGTAFPGLLTLPNIAGFTLRPAILSGLLLAQNDDPVPRPDLFAVPLEAFIVRPFVGTQLSRKRRLG